MLVDFVVAKFQSKQSNHNGAQLIFTTHNTELMNMEILRKDQLYFADKNREDGAGLYDRAVCAGTDEAHMLVRREDISAVSQLMDQKVYRQFRKKYEGWDRQENLEFDARVAGRAQNPVYICR